MPILSKNRMQCCISILRYCVFLRRYIQIKCKDNSGGYFSFSCCNPVFGNMMLCSLMKLKCFSYCHGLNLTQKVLFSSYKATPKSVWTFICWKWPVFLNGNNYSRNWGFLIGFYDSEQHSCHINKIASSLRACISVL